MGWGVGNIEIAEWATAAVTVATAPTQLCRLRPAVVGQIELICCGKDRGHAFEAKCQDFADRWEARSQSVSKRCNQARQQKRGRPLSLTSHARRSKGTTAFHSNLAQCTPFLCRSKHLSGNSQESNEGFRPSEKHFHWADDSAGVRPTANAMRRRRFRGIPSPTSPRNLHVLSGRLHPKRNPSLVHPWLWSDRHS